MDVIGVASVLIPAALQIGFLLFAVRRWTLPFGAVTLHPGGQRRRHDAVIEWRDMRCLWYVIFAALAAGIVGDVLLRMLKPSRENPFALRVFAFAVPFVLCVIYFVLLITQVGIWWEIHKWLGVSFFAARGQASF